MTKNKHLNHPIAVVKFFKQKKKKLIIILIYFYIINIFLLIIIIIKQIEVLQLGLDYHP